MVLPLKKLAVLSLQDISLISLVKTACVFFPAHYEQMNERTACAPFPEDEISTEDNCIPRPRASVQFVVSTVAVAECAGLCAYRAHLFSHEAGTKRDRCVMHTSTVTAPSPSLCRGAHLHLKFTRLYVPALISGTFKLVQLPSSNHLVVLNFPEAWGPSPKFVYTLTVAWRAFGTDPITPGKIPRDAAERT